MTGSDQMGDRLAEITAKGYVDDTDGEWLVAALVAERAQVDFQKRHALAAGLACTAAQKELRAERALSDTLAAALREAKVGLVPSLKHGFWTCNVGMDAKCFVCEGLKAAEAALAAWRVAREGQQ
jgi:hypothetical protein